MTTPLAVFQLPVAFDLIATFFFALTGCLAAIRRNYDIVGVFALSGVCAVGGAVLRDGVFLQTDLPAVVKDPRYLYAILVALAIGPLAAMRVERFGRSDSTGRPGHSMPENHHPTHAKTKVAEYSRNFIDPDFPSLLLAVATRIPSPVRSPSNQGEPRPKRQMSRQDHGPAELVAADFH